MLVRLRRWFACLRSNLECVVSDHQAVVDQFLCLVAGGISCLLMATFYLVIDVLGYRKWVFPFTVIGMNALAVYMATEVYDFRKSATSL